MKKLVLFFFLITLNLSLKAQTPADSCLNARDLGTLPYCETQLFSNLGAEANDSILIFNDCFPDSLADIWFRFIPADTARDYRFNLLPDLIGTPLSSAFVGIYSGDCADNGLQPLYCFSQTDTNEIITEIRDLIAGQTYFIRVGSPDSTSGDFTLCLEARSDDYTIDEGFSTSCEGTLFDNGGAENDYDPNREDIFTICPESDPGCIEFTLTSYELEYRFPEADYMLFYNGPDTMAPLILSTNDLNDGPTAPEGIYGGTGLRILADSGCLTIVFRSDSINQFEGFIGEWSCTEADCEIIDSMTYAINPTEDQIGSQMSTPYTDVQVKKLNCPDSAFAIFNVLQGSTFPIPKGVLLTNGRALDAIGPNDTLVRSTVWDSPGVPMLDTLSMQYGSALRTVDGCELEVTVFAQTDELFMDYVLASEEYQERISGDMNDLAGVFVAGENITPDPMLDPFNQLSNLPDPQNTPVQIFTVNQQNKYSYYHPNPGSLELAYDGYVTDSLNYRRALTARTMVKPCNTYTFRMSVADRDTGLYDSGLFLSDIRAALPNITGPARLIENCPIGNEFVVISSNKPAMDTIKFYLSFSGTAERGVDYIFDVPSPIILAPGEQQAVFPIEAIVDGERENTEQIVMNLSVDYGCGQVEVGSLEITLLDEPYVEIQPGQDTIIACFGEVNLIATGNTLAYEWEPMDAVDDFTNPRVAVKIDQSQWLRIRGYTPGIPCDRFDSVYVLVVSPSGDVNIDRNQLCIGESAVLTASNINGTGFRWEPTTGLSNPNELITTATPNRSTTYQLIVNDRGCEFKRDAFIQVDSLPDLSILTAPDTNPYCKGSTINLSTPPFIRTNYPGLQTNWENYDPTIFVGDPGPAVLNPEILINDPVTLVRTARNGACRDTQTLVIDVIDPVLTLNVTDTLLCPGESFTLLASVSNGTFNNIEYNYEPLSQDIEVSGTGSQVTVAKTGQGTGILRVTITADNCDRTADVIISVPNLFIDLDVMPDVTVGEGEDIMITGTVTPDTIHSVVSYAWCKDDIDLGINSLELIDRVLKESQVYTLKVTDDFGCVYSKDVTITGVPPEYEVPNVFSPNGDGNNDEFGVVFKTGKYDIRSMVIFNRWGQKVFEGTGDQRWDGNHDGKPAVLEVYAYIIELIRPSGEIIYLTGDVTLLR